MTKKIVLLFILVLGLFLVSCGTNEIETTAPSINQPVLGLEDVNEKTVAPEISTENNNPTLESEIKVLIQGSKFSPANLNIKVGTKVTWTNMDAAAHNVKSSDGTLDSPDLSKGDSWSFTFTTKGTYNYICGIHPSMKGSITVE